METLRGRLLLQRETKKTKEELEKIQGIKSYDAIVKTKEGWKCQRCGNQNPKDFYPTPCWGHEGCVYCLSCLQFGKLKSCDRLYHLPYHSQLYDTGVTYLKDSPTLSPAQQRVAKEILDSWNKRRDHYVYAVTGAGKTEMIFPLINQVLRENGQLAMVTPRIDVANELYPRLKVAFPTTPISLLHGQSEKTYQGERLVIASTHQLLRFYHAFDAIILDEGDAFPFLHNPMLEKAVQRALTTSSSLITLSATPTEEDKKKMRSGELSSSLLPRRYHGYDLPVPKLMYIGNWRNKISHCQLPLKLLLLMTRYLQERLPFLLFVPQIDLIPKIERACQLAFPYASFSSVSSKEKLRSERVLKMRQKEVDFLITTTILERGVTFENLQVIILGSEDEIYSMSALIQMSGRVGRKKAYPTGEVWFCHNGQTKAMKKAIKEIKWLNQQGEEG